MKNISLLLLIVSHFMYGQDAMTTSFLKKTPLKADTFISINHFKTTFFTLNNTLLAHNKNKNLKYSNIQLGNITSVNTFNPLKTNVFYKAFNTIIILDNRLAEIYKIDFNSISPYKNISHTTAGSDSSIWVFNITNQSLELFDYKTNKTKAKTLPIESEILDITSNYNACWLLTKDYLYSYNYFGSLLYKIKNTGFTAIKESNSNLFLQKEKGLYYLEKGAITSSPVLIPNLLINQFFVLNEIVYIYADEFLHHHQLKKK